MSTKSQDKKDNESKIKKQNQDLPNIPGSKDEINTEKPVKEQIKDSSKLQKDGKTDNAEENK